MTIANSIADAPHLAEIADAAEKIQALRQGDHQLVFRRYWQAWLVIEQNYPLVIEKASADRILAAADLGLHYNSNGRCIVKDRYPPPHRRQRLRAVGAP